MDLPEKDVVTSFNTTSFSTWSGPVAENDAPSLPPVRGEDNLIKAENATWSDRLFCITDYATDGTSLGPGLSPDFSAVDILHFTKNDFEPFRRMYRRYAGFRYDSIEVRVTATAPKSLVGGIFVGWWPYIDFFDETPSGTRNVYLDNAYAENCITFINSANANLMLFGDSADITFSIPWSFKTPYLPTRWIYTELPNGTQDTRPCPGWPLLWWKLAPSTAFVSSITTYPAKIQVFIKYVNPRFYGPIADVVSPSDFTKQSGAEPLAAAAVAMAADAGVSFISDAMFGSQTPAATNSAVDQSGTYAEPQAVQMSYFGDTQSTDFPSTHPIFRPDMLPSPDYKPPSIHNFLTRPQYIGSMTTGSHKLVAVNPFGLDDYKGQNYFGYFGLINQLWRGTIIFDVVVANHDFVELQLEAKISFPANYDLKGMEYQPTYRGAFSGSKMLTIPVPYLYPGDYQPVYDSPPDYDNTRSSTIFLDLDLSVISTMLDTVPVVPAYLFARAGPDFRFYQPYPPGLYNVEGITPATNRPPPDKKHLIVGVKKKQTKKKTTKDLSGMTKQINLPTTKIAEVFETTAEVTPDPGIYAAYDTVYDYMKLWSRSVSFIDYLPSEEPDTNPTVGLTSPCWFPPVDRARYVEDDNSWFCTQDYVSYLSHLFLYWRGSIATKVAFSSNRSDTITFGYISLAPIVSRTQARTPWSFAPGALPPNANFGAGTVATPYDLQPVLEVSVPYRGLNIWGHCIFNAYQRGIGTDSDFRPASVYTNIELVNDDGVLADSTYRKIDSDFALCFESVLPPYAFWRNRGNGS